MIFQAHVPKFPLDQFIELFVYFEPVEHAHTVDRFLPNGDTEILIDFHDAPKFIYDNNTLKEIQACNRVWASGVRTEPITIPSGNGAAMMVVSRKGGRELIVAGRVDTRVRYQLFVVDRSTGRYRQITNEPEAAFRDPAFSPDGKRIVYVYNKKRTDRAEIEAMYIMKTDGSGRRKLTTYPATDPLAKDLGYKVGPPHWNAKHNFITYQSNQAGKQSIYAVTPDGKKHWKLTDTKLDESWHDWSPDDDWLTFDSRDKATGRYEIMLMNYKTKEIKRLIGASSFKYHQAPVFVKIAATSR